MARTKQTAQRSRPNVQRRAPVRHEIHVAPPTARSTELLTDMPTEMLAWMFLHVRGPPASGALNESRLVCRQWREIIDAHLKCEKPREAYTTAYALGYLSPLGLMPPLGTALIDRFRYLVSCAAGEHDAKLFKSIRPLLDYHFDPRNVITTGQSSSDWEQDLIQRLLGEPYLRILSGAWEGLKVDDFGFTNKRFVHAVDVPRACQMGVEFGRDGYNLGYILGTHGDIEANFAGWSPEQLRLAVKVLKTFVSGGVDSRMQALPWLLRRDLVAKEDFGAWMNFCLMNGDPSVQPDDRRRAVIALCDVIVAREWNDIITAVFLHLAASSELAVLTAVWTACSEDLRRTVWRDLDIIPRPVAINGFTLLGDILNTSTNIDERLDALYAFGVYQDATVEESNALIGRLVNAELKTADREQFIFASPRARADGLPWLLAHLPRPTSTEILRNLAEASDAFRDAILPVFLREENHLPWDPISPNKPYIERVVFATVLVDHGYCLPGVVDSPEGRDLTEDDCRVWSALFTRLTEQPAQRACSFTARFMRHAGALQAGRELLGVLESLGM